jgi:DNA processing protein
VVVEAAERSGTTATARAAAAMNRPVLAVPGPVTSAASAGCHRMIRDGDATLVSDCADLLGLLDPSCAGLGLEPGRGEGLAPTSVANDRDSLSIRERTILDAFPRRGGVGLDAVVRAAGLRPSDVLAGIGILVSTGWIGEADGIWTLLRR